MANFQLHALDAAQFQTWFALDDAALAAQGARRIVVDEAHAYPCRISLTDAEPGSQVLLLHYAHHAVRSAYRASGPIFVQYGARSAQTAPGDIPDYLQRRLISLRAYDNKGNLRCAEVAPGTEIAPLLQAWLEQTEIAYVQLHNARYGCYMCEARRV